MEMVQLDNNFDEIRIKKLNEMESKRVASAKRYEMRTADARKLLKYEERIRRK